MKKEFKAVASLENVLKATQIQSERATRVLCDDILDAYSSAMKLELNGIVSINVTLTGVVFYRNFKGNNESPLPALTSNEQTEFHSLQMLFVGETDNISRCSIFIELSKKEIVYKSIYSGFNTVTIDFVKSEYNKKGCVIAKFNAFVEEVDGIEEVIKPTTIRESPKI